MLAPLQVLDGFGLLKNPPPTTQAIAAAKIADAKPSAENPPGYYGPAGAPRALNLMTPKSLLKPLPAMPLGVERRVYEGDTAQPIKPQLLTIALALLFADIVAVLLLQAGGLLFGRRAGARRRRGPGRFRHCRGRPAAARRPGRRADARRPPPRSPAPTTGAPSRPPPRSPSATCSPAMPPPTRRAARASSASAGS